MLAVIALVVLGPTRLPQAARTAGKWIGELRKLTSRFQDEMSGVLAEPKDAITAAMGDLTKEVGGWRNEVAGMSRSFTTPFTAPAATTPTTPTTPPRQSTWTNSTSNGASTPSTESVSSGLAPMGLPPLPPVPDDPSLN
jgi:sec-independent protein translocase protein TatB